VPDYTPGWIHVQGQMKQQAGTGMPSIHNKKSVMSGSFLEGEACFDKPS